MSTCYVALSINKLTHLLTFSSRLSDCAAGPESTPVVLSSSNLGVLIVMGGAVGVV